MDFCGRCGKELGRGPERGRFCGACGHENAGNARYPLYAESASPRATGTAVATRDVEQPDDDATRIAMPVVSATQASASGASTGPQAAAGAMAGLVASPPVAPAAPAPSAFSATDAAAARGPYFSVGTPSAEVPPAWRTALIALFGALVVLLLLGFLLLMH